jgi:hypothetical protein
MRSQKMNNLLARAGGGESFGGGGFDSSSSFSSGGSSSSSYFSTTDSYTGGGGNCYGCLFFLIVIIVVIVLISQRRKKGLPTGDGSVGTTNNSMGGDEIKSQLKKLKESDPKFDQQKFKTHSKKVFMAVQNGWEERDQAICRPYMAEEVYQSHQMQINDMKKEKVINKLDNIVVGSTDFARIDLDGEFEKITMKVRASMIDYKVNEEAPERPIMGTDKKQSPPFTEYWVFIRKTGVKTKTKDGILNMKCPNCGAPVDNVSPTGVCKYCDATIINGDHDWILSEIIQKSEWN